MSEISFYAILIINQKLIFLSTIFWTNQYVPDTHHTALSDVLRIPWGGGGLVMEVCTCLNNSFEVYPPKFKLLDFTL